jgi:hypothetical protein
MGSVSFGGWSLLILEQGSTQKRHHETHGLRDMTKSSTNIPSNKPLSLNQAILAMINQGKSHLIQPSMFILTPR